METDRPRKAWTQTCQSFTSATFCWLKQITRVGLIQKEGNWHVCIGRGRLIGGHLWKQSTTLALIPFVELGHMEM